MTATSIGVQRVADRDRVTSTLTTAFAADPVVRWMWPAAHDYLHYFPEFVRFYGGRAFEHETAYGSADLLGAALWLPPDVHPEDEALVALFEATVEAEPLRALFDILERLEPLHPPGPHWYLTFLGVDAAQQGRGYGSALLEHTLRACDESHLPAYLESSNPRNVPLYRRYGFEVLADFGAEGLPPITPMSRPAR